MNLDKIDYALIGTLFISLIAIIFSAQIGLVGDAFAAVVDTLKLSATALGFKKLPQTIGGQ